VNLSHHFVNGWSSSLHNGLQVVAAGDLSRVSESGYDEKGDDSSKRLNAVSNT
jgi:hypothetical protein